MSNHRILILGGTTEARALAGALTDTTGHDVLLSLAGRTAAPMAQPVPVRIGGFGGADGLAAALSDGGFDLMIDATHPFARTMARNAAVAASSTGVPAFALRRPEWVRQPADRWIHADDMKAAVAALGPAPKTVFLAIGRQEAARFEQAPRHAYLVRSVDPVTPPLALPHVRYILATGPFEETGEYRLLRDHAIEMVVAKNSGGAATYGKIAAARALGLPVVMIGRPPPADLATVETVDAAMAMIAHRLGPGRKRGV